MSKLAKMQDASLEKLKLLSAAGRNQLQEALEQAKPPTESTSIIEAAVVIPPAEPQAAKSERTAAVKRVVHGKRIGRPPLGPDMRASTVYLPEAAYAELEALAGKSGKKGFKRPGLSETVRAVIRLVTSREWSSEEIRQAFAEDVRVGE